MRLLVASSNAGKIREIRRLLAADAGGEQWEILSLRELSCLWKNETLGALPPVSGREEEISREIALRYAQLAEKMKEIGTSFAENAVIKAKGAAAYTGLLCLAEDSGLEVDYLNGAPGVYSARYAGPEGDEQACNALLLARMRGAAEGERNARYKAVVAVASPGGQLYLAEGACEGRIGFVPAGTGGFGYDPLFILPGGEGTMAELTMEEKNKLSHRGKALAQIAPVLAKLRGGEASVRTSGAPFHKGRF